MNIQVGNAYAQMDTMMMDQMNYVQHVIFLGKKIF